MYHPAAALRGAEIERQSYEDVAKVPQVLLDVRARRDAAGTAPVPAAAAATSAPTTSIESNSAADAGGRGHAPALALAPAREPAPDITIF